MKIAITHSFHVGLPPLEIGSIKIPTGPVFDDGQQSYKLGRASFATRHVGPVIVPKLLPPLDAALFSHAHHLDNLDESGREVRRACRIVAARQERHSSGDRPDGTSHTNRATQTNPPSRPQSSRTA